MILFCSAACFNESVNASATLESAESGGLALPVSRAPLLITTSCFDSSFFSFLSKNLADFLPRRFHVRVLAYGITASITVSTQKSTHNAVLLLPNVITAISLLVFAHWCFVFHVFSLLPTGCGLSFSHPVVCVCVVDWLWPVLSISIRPDLCVISLRGHLTVFDVKPWN